jgi:hypothetical protein
VSEFPTRINKVRGNLLLKGRLQHGNFGLALVDKHAHFDTTVFTLSLAVDAGLLFGEATRNARDEGKEQQRRELDGV